MIHDWWAVELRRALRPPDSFSLARETESAIEHVLEYFERPEEMDCGECFERWMDEASGGRQIDDFPQALNEEHVIRILALEDAVLVRHGLEQWLVALGARRAREIERALAESREWALET